MFQAANLTPSYPVGPQDVNHLDFLLGYSGDLLLFAGDNLDQTGESQYPESLSHGDSAAHRNLWKVTLEKAGSGFSSFWMVLSSRYRATPLATAMRGNKSVRFLLEDYHEPRP